ncbi:MAG: hypothetical protein LBQ34_05385 [Alphaproteobacteria bacterium]|jgi:hypothetical protein|nr:hypothetical protein [Alphaproteobacteria bacterium]
MAIGINFFHYSLIILVITALALIISSIFNKKLAETLITAILLIIFYLYWFALFGILKFGYWSLITFIILGFLTCLLVKRKQLLSYFSAGYWIYVILVAIIAVIFRDYFIYFSDDIAHWGITAKDMFFYSKIIPREYNDYSIGTRVFQYFMLKIYGSWNESIILTYFYIIYFAFVVCPLAKIEEYQGKSKYPVMLFYGILTLLFITLFKVIDLPNMSNIFRYLAVDLLLGLTFGFTLFVVSEKKFLDYYDKLNCFLLLFALVQIKTSGLILAIAIVCLIVLKYKKIKIGLFFVIPIFLSKASWSIYTLYNNYSNNNTRRFINSSKKVLEINDFSYYYWYGLLERYIFLYLSPIVLMVLFSVLALYLIVFHKNIRSYIVKLYLVLFVLVIVFNFGLYSIYIRAFSDGERLHLAAFERYQLTVWGGVIFMLLLYLPRILMKFKKHIILLLLLCIISGIFTYQRYKHDRKISESHLKNRFSVNVSEIKHSLPNDFSNRNIVVFSDRGQFLMLRLEIIDQIGSYSKRAPDIFMVDWLGKRESFSKRDPDILIIYDKERYKQEIIDYIKLHNLNINFEDIKDKSVIVP